jgi:hypothetical protein
MTMTSSNDLFRSFFHVIVFGINDVYFCCVVGRRGDDWCHGGTSCTIHGASPSATIVGRPAKMTALVWPVPPEVRYVGGALGVLSTLPVEDDLGAGRVAWFVSLYATTPLARSRGVCYRQPVFFKHRNVAVSPCSQGMARMSMNFRDRDVKTLAWDEPVLICLLLRSIVPLSKC